MSRLVVDSSAVVALLVDDGPGGAWVAQQLAGNELAAPALMPFEVGNVLRREVVRGAIEDHDGSQAHRQLTALAVQMWSFDSIAARAWSLRATLTTYDAAYVAVAEVLDAPLLTLDGALGRAPGPRCSFLVPP